MFQPLVECSGRPLSTAPGMRLMLSRHRVIGLCRNSREQQRGTANTTLQFVKLVQ